MAIEWVAKRDGITLKEYMRRHQHDSDCSDLWTYFNLVMTWVKMKFIGKHANLYTATNWGEMYRLHKDDEIDAKKLEEWINDYPRKVIDYDCSAERFRAELEELAVKWTA